MNSVMIRKGAMGEVVHVECDGHTTVLDLSNETKYNKVQYLNALVNWALNGFMGFPPNIKR